ncbi:hypothetical protein A3C89_03705 [Candidatus Kaiserbacteria bacterium RIFCSPHIGHO2_02_FULL_50_50]|uniref:General secretion pathway GspH domain-containing protein n=1 Tax=Candidatus Kaiserbacteria bacterium RIFCSPHIGHO2_02_FULL_50_50 TaxID=1798492 RepID=A0A1F6DC14_9BACT|nr:MAG: hypothetical protein A3C89_03705 [Candidatus Kaiserbacteria bacterium RIFCSPHIGHO2_02_FULL_50_50]
MSRRILYTRGVSLLEMLLVVAILGLLASTVFVMLPQGGGETEVVLAAEQLRTELATMRSRARSGEDRASFGVMVATSSYTTIKVEGATTTTLGMELLPTNVTATPALVTFETISGRSAGATITLQSSQASTTIIVSGTGAIQ